jgi:hypothetical protein
MNVSLNDSVEILANQHDLSMIFPTCICSPPGAVVVQVKAIDVDFGFYECVLKKQRPPVTAAPHPAPEGARGVSDLSIRLDTILSKRQLREIDLKAATLKTLPAAR